MDDPKRGPLSRLSIDIQIRRFPGVSSCYVVVTTENRELILSCPDYERATRWADMECRSYGIPPRFQKTARTEQLRLTYMPKPLTETPALP